TITNNLYDEAKAKGWTVISMKNDWKQIFAWEKWLTRPRRACIADREHEQQRACVTVAHFSM
ncbi:MAG: hypothetical protein WB555_14405, partial [Candidatus Korobacteraceae bacterium]